MFLSCLMVTKNNNFNDCCSEKCFLSCYKHGSKKSDMSFHQERNHKSPDFSLFSSTTEPQRLYSDPGCSQTRFICDTPLAQCQVQICRKLCVSDQTIYLYSVNKSTVQQFLWMGLCYCLALKTRLLVFGILLVGSVSELSTTKVSLTISLSEVINVQLLPTICIHYPADR